MKRLFGIFLAFSLAAALPLGAFAAKKGPDPSPSPSGGSPAPLPTATPEPADIAVPRLEAKIKADPNNREAMADLAGYYLSLGRPDKVLPLTQKLIQIGQKTAQVYYLDGVANQSLNRQKEAVADLEQAATLEPTNSTILLRLTDLYLRSNRAADAERVAKRALTFNKDDKQAILNYGLVLAQESKYDDARKQFEEAAAKDPKDPTAIIIEAKSYEDQKAWEYAAQTYDKALAIDPKNVEAMTGKAGDFVQENKIPEAIAVYEQLLALAPTDDDKVALLNQEAIVYATHKQQKDADAIFAKIMATYPKSIAAHLDYGDYLAQSNQVPKAEAEWKAALALQPNSRDALARLGNLYLGTTQNATSIEYLKKISDAEPSNPEIAFALGRAYSFGRQYDRAREACGRSFEILRTPQALACIGASDFEVKKYSEAAKVFDALDKNATQYLNSNPQFLFFAARSYERDNQKAKARTMYKRFLAYVKPNTQAASEVKKMLSDMDRGSPPAKASPAPKATPAKK